MSRAGPYFEDVVIRPIESSGSKRDDIEAILARTGLPPARCAVVGDDLKDELRFASELGCATIHVPKTPLSDITGILTRGGAGCGNRSHSRPLSRRAKRGVHAGSAADAGKPHLHLQQFL